METPGGKYRISLCLFHVLLCSQIGFQHSKKDIDPTKNGLNTNLSSPPPPKKVLTFPLIKLKCSISHFEMFLKFSRFPYV